MARFHIPGINDELAWCGSAAALRCRDDHHNLALQLRAWWGGRSAKLIAHHLLSVWRREIVHDYQQDRELRNDLKRLSVATALGCD